MSAWNYISELDAFEIYHQVQQEVAKPSDDFSFTYALRNALSGAGGTAVSNVVTYPLDLVCTRLQVQTRGSGKSDDQYDGVVDAVRKIYDREGGVKAFYNGLAPDTFKSIVDSFLFFLAYNVISRARKNNVRKFEHPALLALDGISVGFLAGTVTKAVTTPITVVVTRQQTQRAADEQSASEIIAEIYKRDGLKGFWKGYSASLVLTLNPALTFFVDAALRRVLRLGKDSGPVATFVLAASGKATANVLMYPVKLAKARAQVARDDKPSDTPAGKGGAPAQPKPVPASPLAMILRIARAEGAGALYAGVWAEVFKGFFSHGLTMLVKDQIPSLVIQLYFLLARLAGLQRDASTKKD